MSPADIANYRLLNQQIACTTCKTPAEVVTTLGAMQAQDYLGVLWSIGLRLPGSKEAEVRQAIVDRTIIRTWPMRGTLHFVPAIDVRWMLALLTPRIVAGNARRYEQLELDAAIFSKSRDVFINALQGGRELPRDEIYELLDRAGISPAK